MKDKNLIIKKAMAKLSKNVDWDAMFDKWQKMRKELDSKLQLLGDIVWESGETESPAAKTILKHMHEVMDQVKVLDEEAEEFTQRNMDKSAKSLDEVSFPVKFIYKSRKNVRTDLGSCKDSKDILKHWDLLGEKISDGDLDDEGEVILKDSENNRFKVKDIDSVLGDIELE